MIELARGRAREAGEEPIDGDRVRLPAQDASDWTVAVMLEHGADGWRIAKEELDVAPPA